MSDEMAKMCFDKCCNNGAGFGSFAQPFTPIFDKVFVCIRKYILRGLALLVVFNEEMWWHGVLNKLQKQNN